MLVDPASACAHQACNTSAGAQQSQDPLLAEAPLRARRRTPMPTLLGYLKTGPRTHAWRLQRFARAR
eukprot:1673171-Alexandrium_andersonii.AAC.1